MEENTKRKPMIIELEEAKGELVDAINNVMQVHNLPCYFVEMLLGEIYTQIRNGANRELEAAKTQMNTEEA